MTDIKWEYCVLEWLRFNVDPKQRGTNGESSDAKEQPVAIFGVRFGDSAGKAANQILHKITIKDINDKSKQFSFAQGLGLLGTGGWELVSINQEPDRGDLCTITSAYMKRPIVDGRGINEPQIVIE